MTEYTVVARRYRPKQFAELIGQEPVARALTNALKSGRVAHAYLFTGARGVGKTSAARILAKALNCATGTTPTPCDQCDSCTAVAAGQDVDVLEIDGASNRGIDEIREIRQNVQFRPSRSRHKIYIIDEVHMLTAPAFNALLKTLEEPPPAVKFIFATTEVQSIPVTILSRCQRFDFAHIAAERIAGHLAQILAAEGRTADADAIELVARRAAGSMRDGESLLDQLLAFGGDRVTAEQVHQLLGTAPEDRVAELAGAVFDRDPKRALQQIDRELNRGCQPGELLDQLIDYWRDLMLLATAGDSAPGLTASQRFRPALIGQARAAGLDAILAGLDILAAAKAKAKFTGQPRVLLEMAVVRLGRLDELIAVADLARMIAAGEPLKPPSPPPGGGKKKSPSGDDAAPPRPMPPVPAPRTVSDVWTEALGQLGSVFRGMLGRAAPPVQTGPHHLVVRFDSEYHQSYAYCSDKVGELQEALRRVTGQPWQVRIECPSAAPTAVAASSSAKASGRGHWGELVEREPLLKHVIDLFEAKPVSVDDGFGEAETGPADDTWEPDEE